jgi:hypothetical protein
MSTSKLAPLLSTFVDTFMFLIGAYWGYLLNYIFDHIDKRNPGYSMLVGMLQLFCIAVTMRYVNTNIKEIAGLFTLGFLTTQTIIIKRYFIIN